MVGVMDRLLTADIMSDGADITPHPSANAHTRGKSSAERGKGCGPTGIKE